eukprot:2521396-Amphidinium_carterae.1
MGHAHGQCINTVPRANEVGVAEESEGDSKFNMAEVSRQRSQLLRDKRDAAIVKDVLHQCQRETNKR